MYLLDTNILSELIKKRPSPLVLSQLGSNPAHTLFTSCICIHFSRIKGLKVENWLEAV
jgi:predicted nucleic acid-binding protein